MLQKVRSWEQREITRKQSKQGLRNGRGSSSGAATRQRRMMKREPMMVLQGLLKRKVRKRIY